jgi:hypothetical protein
LKLGCACCLTIQGNKGEMGLCRVYTRTKDEFLGRGQHVEREGDFVLVFFELEPAEDGGEVGFGAEGPVGAGGRGGGGGGCVGHGDMPGMRYCYSGGRLRG